MPKDIVTRPRAKCGFQARECEFCEDHKKRETREEYDIHILTHDFRLALYVCEVDGCGLRFFTEKRLNDHINNTCKCCSITYSDSSTKRRHERAREGVRYFCPVPGCGTKEMRLEKVRKHLSDLHGVDGLAYDGAIVAKLDPGSVVAPERPHILRSNESPGHTEAVSDGTGSGEHSEIGLGNPSIRFPQECESPAWLEYGIAGADSPSTTESTFGPSTFLLPNGFFYYGQPCPTPSVGNANSQQDCTSDDHQDAGPPQAQHLTCSSPVDEFYDSDQDFRAASVLSDHLEIFHSLPASATHSPYSYFSSSPSDVAFILDEANTEEPLFSPVISELLPNNAIGTTSTSPHSPLEPPANELFASCMLSNSLTRSPLRSPLDSLWENVVRSSYPTDEHSKMHSTTSRSHTPILPGPRHSQPSMTPSKNTPQFSGSGHSSPSPTSASLIPRHLETMPTSGHSPGMAPYASLPLHYDSSTDVSTMIPTITVVPEALPPFRSPQVEATNMTVQPIYSPHASYSGTPCPAYEGFDSFYSPTLSDAIEHSPIHSRTHSSGRSPNRDQVSNKSADGPSRSTSLPLINGKQPLLPADADKTVFPAHRSFSPLYKSALNVALSDSLSSPEGKFQYSNASLSPLSQTDSGSLGVAPHTPPSFPHAFSSTLASPIGDLPVMSAAAFHRSSINSPRLNSRSTQLFGGPIYEPYSHSLPSPLLSEVPLLPIHPSHQLQSPQCISHGPGQAMQQTVHASDQHNKSYYFPSSPVPLLSPTGRQPSHSPLGDRSILHSPALSPVTSRLACSPARRRGVSKVGGIGSGEVSMRKSGLSFSSSMTPGATPSSYARNCATGGVSMKTNDWQTQPLGALQPYTTVHDSSRRHSMTHAPNLTNRRHGHYTTQFPSTEESSRNYNGSYDVTKWHTNEVAEKRKWDGDCQTGYKRARIDTFNRD